MAEMEPDYDLHVQQIINSNIHILSNLSSSAGWEKHPLSREKSQNEKRISVDPISLRSAEVIVSVPLQKPNYQLQAKGSGCVSSKFLNFSLPNSATSSPLTAVLKMQQQKKKMKSKDGLSVNPLFRQHSVALTNLERLRENHLRRSKSCGEGRTCQPSVDFDILSRASSNSKINKENDEILREPASDHHRMIIPSSKPSFDQGNKFKCGALCLFLPSFNNKAAKPVKAGKDHPAPDNAVVGGHVVSQRVSLEKFECGSWRSSAVIEDRDISSNMFFDLPMELIRYSNVNDAELPVTAGFVFDNNTNTSRKGVLKTCNSMAARASSSSSKLASSESSSNNLLRHVQFSDSSSPKSSITPRLRKARDDFNAFLEAQNA